MDELLDHVCAALFDRKNDSIWINPYQFHLGKIKHFYAMREFVKPHGICLAYIEDGIVDTHCWYFYKKGDDDLPGWLKIAHDP